MANTQHLIINASAPTSTPEVAGKHYIDTLNGKNFISVATNSYRDWWEVRSGPTSKEVMQMDSTDLEEHRFNIAQYANKLVVIGNENDDYQNRSIELEELVPIGPADDKLFLGAQFDVLNLSNNGLLIELDGGKGKLYFSELGDYLASARLEHNRLAHFTYMGSNEWSITGNILETLY